MTSLPTLESVIQVDLTRGPDRETLLGAGWPGMDAGVGCRLGQHDGLNLALPDEEGAIFLQLKLAPPTHETAAPPVTLRLIVNDCEIAVRSVDRMTTLTEYVPSEVLDSSATLRLRLDEAAPETPAPKTPAPETPAPEIPAAEAPAEDRPGWIGLYALRVLRVVERPARGLPMRDAPEAPPLREMLLDFESLGEGPAFAQFRRRHNVRPLDVMQAGHAPLRDWLALLDSDFAAFTVPGAIHAKETGHTEDPSDGQTDGEATWSVHCTGYDFHYDTGVPAGMRKAAAVEAHETARLAIATRRLRHTLASGNKILLLQQDEPASDEQIIPLLAAVQDRGPNAILWVTPADADHPAGSLEVLMNGLLRGYVAPGTGEASDPDWTAMCRRAWRIWRAMSDGAAAAEAA